MEIQQDIFHDLKHVSSGICALDFANLVGLLNDRPGECNISDAAVLLREAPRCGGIKTSRGLKGWRPSVRETKTVRFKAMYTYQSDNSISKAHQLI